MSGNNHDHGRRQEKPKGDDSQGFDWFAIMDVAIWAAVAIITVVGIEWLVGHVIRESLAAGASKHLKRQVELGKPAGETP